MKRSQLGNKVFFVVVLLAFLPILIGLIEMAVSFDDTNTNALTGLSISILGIIFSIFALSYKPKRARLVVVVLCVIWFIYLAAASAFTVMLSGIQF